jgi:hypothetical protein
VIAIGFSAARIVSNPEAFFASWASSACAAVTRSVVVIPGVLVGQERYRSLSAGHHAVRIQFQHAHEVSDLDIER